MITNVIQNRKQKEFIVKVVLGTESQAIENCNEISDYIDNNSKLIEKMNIGLGLVELKVNDVFNSVIIQYEFKTAKEAKHFSSIFSENLEDDYSNLLDTIFVFEKREVKTESTYEVSLNLPPDIHNVFVVESIDSVCTIKYPSIKINRELMAHNKQKVLLVIEDFSSELIAIKLTKSGNTYYLPQQWLDIQEKAIKGVYNTQWVMDLKNFIKIEDNAIISKNKNGSEVRVEQQLIKLDGENSKFIEDKNGYIDIVSKICVPKEIVVLSAS
jgi:hypothetical protein